MQFQQVQKHLRSATNSAYASKSTTGEHTIGKRIIIIIADCGFIWRDCISFPGCKAATVLWALVAHE